ncbi:dethiobiotin synthase [Corynebacterium pygosceleis]|uniref:dethiobiotin synthase n=1 Tax=Corynebacterium pygosceleis TaxID=2800406 RepID=UPI00190778E5|nr:dethiobiotin synthase [Corynebacterium pygosceleis]MCK7674594.1 dethiobiotin synthase [Corynebacterium pygosceleis]MCL0120104.1 dethiobiotin synthase [Corynebacterium pygosceleis]
MTVHVITGTNTDVGKTIATAALAVRLCTEGRAVTVVKPAQTGEPEGAGDLATVRGFAGAAVGTVEFARYPEPLAPNLSARRAGLPQLDLAATVRRIRALDAPGRTVLVEGAGGLLVRIADDWTIADLAGQLGAPVTVVTSLGLGSLNAAELTVEAARRRGLTVTGLIGGSLSRDPDLATGLNLAELPEVTGVPLLGCLPEGAGSLDREEFTRVSGNLDTRPFSR